MYMKSFQKFRCLRMNLKQDILRSPVKKTSLNSLQDDS